MLKKWKTLFFISLLMLWCCDTRDCIPNGPDEIVKTGELVEFLYERVLTEISPSEPLPSGFIIYHYNYGGFSTYWTDSRNNICIGSIFLEYHGQPYYIWVVEKVGEKYTGVARKFSARIKGEEHWIELTKIEKNTMSSGGEWASFILSRNGIQIPK